MLALVPRLVPRDLPSASRRLDLIGLVIAVPAVFLIVLPLMLGHSEGWPVWMFACIGLGAALGAVFVYTERRVADPLLDLTVLRSPGLAAGLATTAVIMLTYGGFLFSFALHLQSGLGDSALTAGLTFAPCAAAFGLCGYYWRRLPSRSHHVLPPVGCLLAAACYAAVALVLRSGSSGGSWLQVFLILTGATLALAFSPLVTHSLVHVPVSRAADASGLVTTTMQLSQAVGVATFGSLFLTLDSRAAAATVSGHAIAVTLASIAVVLVVGVPTGASLARTVASATRD